MGRGRAKAKQTKVARELKYNSGSMDLNRLRADLIHEHGSRSRSIRERWRGTATSPTATRVTRSRRRGRGHATRRYADAAAERRAASARARRTVLPTRVTAPPPPPLAGGVAALAVARARAPRRRPSRRPRARASRASAASTDAGGDHGDHADAHVERLLQLEPGHRAEPSDQVEDRLRGPGRAVHVGSQVRRGSTRARFAARPPPVTWRSACTSTSAAAGQRQAVQRVDPGGLEQLLAERAAELVDVQVEPQPGRR